MVAKCIVYYARHRTMKASSFLRREKQLRICDAQRENYRKSAEPAKRLSQISINRYNAKKTSVRSFLHPLQTGFSDYCPLYISTNSHVSTRSTEQAIMVNGRFGFYILPASIYVDT